MLCKIQKICCFLRTDISSANLEVILCHNVQILGFAFVLYSALFLARLLSYPGSSIRTELCLEKRVLAIGLYNHQHCCHVVTRAFW